MALWLKENNRDCDVVVSSRVRLARNIAGLPFPAKLRGTKSAELVKDAGRKAFLSNGSGFTMMEMEQCPPIERARLAEQHVISRELAELSGGACIVSKDESITIMMMEEDHFRLQCMASGLDIDGAFSGAKAAEKMLSQTCSFAFSKEFGYLTSCPTNVGTGMRASIMLHLPALAISGRIGGVLSSIGKFGVTARGAYGEGSQAYGNLYQISNQITLGASEEEIQDTLKVIVNQIIEQERSLRKALFENPSKAIEDKVLRAWGALLYSRRMDSKEALELLSLAGMGVSNGIIGETKENAIYQLMMDVMPAMMSKDSQEDRDILRSRLIRERLRGE